MIVVDLADVDAGMVEQVGGKAAGLGEMTRAGERVPAGFCLTTEAYRSGEIPEQELTDAYQRLGGGPVAVRSSATAEDLPDASFAGQQETYLNVEGVDALLHAVRQCWDSLHTDRAVAYRSAHGIDEAAMAVVVQRMVDAKVAGVLFTANPVTGTRTETVIDAAPGLGTAVVDGSVSADHYVLGDAPPAAEHGCLDAAQLVELREAGQRLQRHFGTPQDIEWATDHEGTLWLLQSRAITTLFPLPETDDRDGLRVYFEFGHMEGMLQPFTPMGMSVFRLATTAMASQAGIAADPDRGSGMVVGIAGRLYLDITDLVHDRTVRGRLPELARLYGPRSAAALAHVCADPRFAPQRGRAYRLSVVAKVVARFGPALVAGVAASLARPAAERARALRMVEQIRQASLPPAHLADLARPGLAAQRVRFARDLQGTMIRTAMTRAAAPVITGMQAGLLAGPLLSGVATPDEVAVVLRGLPYNVTTEMDLQLWRIAANAGEHRDLLLTTPPAELAARYLAGTLPDIGLGEFLATYGRRGVAEVDVGVPRWAEDPTPVFASIANYLRITDPEQAPDRRFAATVRQAKAAYDELMRRARRVRPVRARLAGFLLRRARALGGLRELGKFMWLYPLAEARRQLLAAGADLTERGLLDRPDDIMFLSIGEAAEAAAGADLRARIVARRARYQREMRRTSVPGLLLSDGTDVEAVTPRPPAPEGALVGIAAAPGTATGRARVIRDPSGARVEPGDILVTPTTDPGWTPLFLTATGLVSETGSPMSHGPTVAREYGIPAVVGVPAATEKIHTGQLITIDGAAGLITLDISDDPE